MLTPIMKIGIHHIYIKDTDIGKMAALNTVLSIWWVIKSIKTMQIIF